MCKKCNVEKELNQYRIQKSNGKERYCSWCRDCEKEYNSLYDKTNKKRIEYKKQYRKNYQEKNSEKLKQYFKKHYQEHKEEIKEKYIQVNLIEPYWKKEWYKEYRRSPEYKEYRQKLLKNKMKTDKVFIYKMKTRKLISRAFYDVTFKKYDELKEIVGCSYNKLLYHLFDTFYNNYNIQYCDYDGKVNIDHIIPLNEAKTIEDVKKLNHYTNLQLLKEKDNQLKGTKILENLTK